MKSDLKSKWMIALMAAGATILAGQDADDPGASGIFVAPPANANVWTFLDKGPKGSVFIDMKTVTFHESTCDTSDPTPCHYAYAWIKIVMKSGEYHLFLSDTNREKKCYQTLIHMAYTKAGKPLPTDRLPLTCQANEPDSVEQTLYNRLFDKSADANAQSSEAPVPDGRLWNDMSPDERLIFVYAYDLGAGQGADVGVFSANPGKSDEEIASIVDHAQDHLSPLGRLSPLETVAMITKFYKDPQNQAIEIDDAIHVVARQVAGNSPEATAARLTELREKKPHVITDRAAAAAAIQAAQIDADARVRAAEIKAQAKVLVAETQARTAQEQLRAHREANKRANSTGGFLRALALAWLGRERRPTVTCNSNAAGGMVMTSCH